MLSQIDILQIYPDNASDAGRRAMRFASCIAQKMGAKLFCVGDAKAEQGYGFYDADETSINANDIDRWLADQPSGRCRIVISTGADANQRVQSENVGSIFIELDSWHTEETLFAASGVSGLLGEPDREPITPAGNYAAHTIGYSAFCALSAIAIMRRRFAIVDDAIVYGDGVLSWVSWKSAINAKDGTILNRRGANSEWPTIPCKDGHVAFLFTDWSAMAEMIGEPKLAKLDFGSFKKKGGDLAEVAKIINAWCSERTKSEIASAFEKAGLPGAPVLTIPDLANDPLMQHRNYFEKTASGGVIPGLPSRVEKATPSPKGAPSPADVSSRLPLAGMRVLDFGIITAGAGVTAMLADMGAEVLKIESQNRPDPFRRWLGSEGESPSFRCNNRNKLGVAVDLKTEEGRKAIFELAQTADIVVENYRRGVLDRLGLTFEALKEANPSILLASISSQGLHGPGTKNPTYGSTLEATSGFSDLTKYEDDGAPHISGVNLNYPDQTVCLYGAAAIGLYATDCKLNGIARHIDISQRDTTIFQLGDVIGFATSTGKTDLRSIKNAIARPALSQVFKCADGRYAALTASAPSTAEKISDLPSISEEDVAEWAAVRDAAAAVAAFIAAGAGGSVVHDGRDILEDEVLREQSFFATGPDGALVKGFPYQLAQNPMTIWRNSPAVGEHTNEIFNKLKV